MSIMVALVGMTHHNGAEELLEQLPADEPLMLIRDPANPRDRNAIQVWARGQMLGFIKASQAVAVAAAIDQKLALDAAFKPPARLKRKAGKWPMVEID